MRACRPARVADVMRDPASLLAGQSCALPARSDSLRFSLPSHARSNSHTSSAFWACSRFSASSHTALCGPSMTSSVISCPRCAGRQCSTTALGVGEAHQFAVDLERAERPHPVESVVLLAHRRPGVGDQDVGAVGGRSRIGGDGDGGPGVVGSAAARRRRTSDAVRNRLGRRWSRGFPRSPRPASASAPCCWRRRRSTSSAGPSACPCVRRASAGRPAPGRGGTRRTAR